MKNSQNTDNIIGTRGDLYGKNLKTGRSLSGAVPQDVYKRQTFLYQVVDGELKAVDAEYDEDYEAWKLSLIHI